MNSSLAFPRSLILLLIYLLSQPSAFLAISCLSYIYCPSYLLSQLLVVLATCTVPAICFPSHQLSQPYIQSQSCAPSYTLCLQQLQWLQQLQSLGLVLQIFRFLINYTLYTIFHSYIIHVAIGRLVKYIRKKALQYQQYRFS